MFSPVTMRFKIYHFRPVAAVAALLVLAGCSEEVEQAREIIRPVKVIEIAAAETSRTVSYSGSVRARSEMALAFRVGGKITERPVDIGDRVEAGQVLARLDAADLNLSVRSAEANLSAAERQVETTRLARDRAERLRAKNVAAQSQLEEAGLAYNQATATRDAALAALEQARNQAAYADLSSASAGIVTAVEAEPGQVVAAGTPVVSVALDGEKEVAIAVPETDILAFSLGKSVAVRFWSDAKLELTGKVREISGSADPRSRTFAVRVSLTDDPRILLGMTATVEATVETGAELVSIPLSALAKGAPDAIVWTVDPADSTVHSRPVEVGTFADDGVSIADGLKPGDTVVVAGTQFMREGMKVRLPGEPAETASAEDTPQGAILR